MAVSILFLSLVLPLTTGSLPGSANPVVRRVATQLQATNRPDFATAGPRLDETYEAIDGIALGFSGLRDQPAPWSRSSAPAAVADGNGTVAPVTIRVDGINRTVAATEATVREVLVRQNIAVALHDRVTPALGTTLVAGSSIEVTHVRSWLERIRSSIAPPITHKYDVSMTRGTARVIDAGAAGTRETTIAVLRPDAAVAPKRLLLAARVLRLPRMRILAEGVGDGLSLSRIARRGFLGTMNLADAALRMIATAYTARCSGCTGLTASGRPAGHGVVAVDPRIIPLGSHLFIPGYGHAYAGDTGGAIHGNRIDLGFDSFRDARTFGRRPIVVYIFH